MSKQLVEAIQRDTPIETLLFTWLNGDTILLQDIVVSSGILKYAIAWNHTTSVNHEDGGFMIVNDKTVIHPTQWDNKNADMPARVFFPFFVGILRIPLMNPIPDGSRLGVEISAAPVNGFSVILGFEPLKFEREVQKAIIKATAKGIKVKTD